MKRVYPSLMKKLTTLLALLLVSQFALADADLKIVGVSRLPDQDFYLGSDSVKFNVTVYNYGDVAGEGVVRINATGNSEIECSLPVVEALQISTAICQSEITIKNTTNLVEVKLYSGDVLVSNKNLTLYSTAEFTKKTRVPDSNPLVVIATVLVALVALNFSGKKQKRKKAQGSLEFIALVAGAGVFVLIVVLIISGTFNAPAKKVVVTQGSLIQEQIGALSNALRVNNPITMRRPLMYGGLATSPSAIAFQNNVCIGNATLFTDESGEMIAVETIEELNSTPVGTLQTFQHQFQVNGVWHYNVLVCTCENECGWKFSDAEGNPINQQVEIVAQGDARYNAAYQTFLAQGNPRGGSAPSRVPGLGSRLTDVSWHCENGFPVGIVTIGAYGENLVSVSARCHAGRQVLPEVTRNINRGREYSLILLGQELGENVEVTCSSSACNTTECVQQREARSTRTCRTQAGVQNAGALQVNNNALQFSVNLDRVEP